jgi:hypothetical protein
MGRRKGSIRGRVILAWEKRGRPEAWDVQQTLAVCIEVDEELRAAGCEPAPRFREATELGNRKYLTNWVQGCHFPWLNPR